MKRIKDFLYRLREFLYQFLRVDFIRFCIAAIRYFFLVKIFRRMKTWDTATGDIGVNAVHHNMLGLKSIKWLAVNRSYLLLYPLAALHINKNTPLLCIGPRSEGEILNCRGLGFKNTRGLDLISYSPWVDLGDMHSMPYEDNQFGVVIMGWVLAYSENRVKAAKEALRIVKDGGVIAVGVEYTNELASEASKKVGYELCDKDRMESVAEILDLFSPHVDRTLFMQDLPSTPCERWNLLAIFSVKKS